VEGGDAIQDLRREVPHTNLEHLLTTAGQEIASSQISHDSRPNFRVTVEGSQQALSASAFVQYVSIHALSIISDAEAEHEELLDTIRSVQAGHRGFTPR